jgi:AmiR/NasT family two-component response regulator
MTTLLAVTNDLIAAAPIEQAARQQGVAWRVVPAHRYDELDLDQLQLVVLDLNAVDQVAEAVAELKATVGAATPIVAFGPHVHAAKLQAARDAGCAQVLTRGQFHGHAPEIIAQALSNAK